MESQGTKIRIMELRKAKDVLKEDVANSFPGVGLLQGEVKQL